MERKQIGRERRHARSLHKKKSYLTFGGLSLISGEMGMGNVLKNPRYRILLMN